MYVAEEGRELLEHNSGRFAVVVANNTRLLFVDVFVHGIARASTYVAQGHKYDDACRGSHNMLLLRGVYNLL